MLQVRRFRADGHLIGDVIADVFQNGKLHFVNAGVSGNFGDRVLPIRIDADRSFSGPNASLFKNSGRLRRLLHLLHCPLCTWAQPQHGA